MYQTRDSVKVLTFSKLRAKILSSPHIAPVGIAVSELDTSAAFYTELLGKVELPNNLQDSIYARTGHGL
jgi:catechol-2,3-dioxygenase